MTAAQALGEFLIYYLRVLVFLLFYSLQPTGKDSMKRQLVMP